MNREGERPQPTERFQKPPIDMVEATNLFTLFDSKWLNQLYSEIKPKKAIRTRLTLASENSNVQTLVKLGENNLNIQRTTVVKEELGRDPLVMLQDIRLQISPTPQLVYSMSVINDEDPPFEMNRIDYEAIDYAEQIIDAPPPNFKLVSIQQS